jgi:hypothetical protein
VSARVAGWFAGALEARGPARFDDREWRVDLSRGSADAEELDSFGCRRDPALLGGSDPSEHAGFDRVLLAADVEGGLAAEAV